MASPLQPIGSRRGEAMPRPQSFMPTPSSGGSTNAVGSTGAVRVATRSESAWCFASSRGADCRCRGTMLGPHCALLRQGCSRFRGSGAMLSPEWGHFLLIFEFTPEATPVGAPHAEPEPALPAPVHPDIAGCGRLAYEQQDSTSSTASAEAVESTSGTPQSSSRSTPSCPQVRSAEKCSPSRNAPPMSIPMGLPSGLAKK